MCLSIHHRFNDVIESLKTFSFLSRYREWFLFKGACPLLLLFLVPCLLTSCEGSLSDDGDHPATKYQFITGSISLKIHLSDSGTLIDGSTIDTKYENAAIDLSFHLPVVSLSQSPGVSNTTWKDPVYGGSAYWSEVHTTEYDCEDTRATDFDTTIRVYADTASGFQPGGVQFSIQSDGSYGISVTALSSGTPTTEIHSLATNCKLPTYTSNSTKVSEVPFNNYFTPYTNGAKGSLTGMTDKSEPSHLKGTFNGTDIMTLFSQVTIPVTYTITWDFTMSN